MFSFNVDDKVVISFNKMPDEERERLTNAISVGKQSGKALKSKVDQANHQTEPQSGTIVEQRGTADGVQYLVRVDVKNSGAGRLRVIPEGKLSLQ